MNGMACKTSFEFHHHFPKLAEESGFTFNTHRPRINIDWNKIKLIDIDSLIKERQFVIIEQHLNDILDCVFESEFDVRILNEGVMKMFRLAQLTVEYQQFCRHYLDRSVFVLRKEITSLARELDICKKDLQEKEEEIKRLRKRSRHSFKTTLPYGNDNIAAMILKTLSNKGDIFSSPSNETMHYNKCNYCDKVFLNQLYLKSHLTRRHPNVIEVPENNKAENTANNENTKLSTEITELKSKIKEMENIITITKNQISNERNDSETTVIIPEKQIQTQKSIEIRKDMRDVEVSTGQEDYLLNKFEEWKKQEYENYNNEMAKLRIQIMETINTIKENQKTVPTESNLIIQLQDTIKQQGSEILVLKKALNDSMIKSEKENVEKIKEADAQVIIWAQRAETQSKQYELLLQKLNDVARDAKESRALAEAERERATQLNALLQEKLNSSTNNTISMDRKTSETQSLNATEKKSTKLQPDSNKSQKPNHASLDKLHRKAQELLKIASITSSSSDVSSSGNYNLKTKPFKHKNIIINDKIGIENDKMDNSNMVGTSTKGEDIKSQKIQGSFPHKSMKLLNGKELKEKKKKRNVKNVKGSKCKNGPTTIPGSPLKLVRAKITEEVNTRLVSAGVDPLKSRLPRYVFQKHRNQLHQHHELKAKKNPAHDQVKHAIQAFLDSSAMEVKKEITHVPDYISPTKVNKPFKSFTSVISNVKTKALSLVKLNDSNLKEKQKSQNAEVAKRVISLLKTPPGSAPTSPNSFISNDTEKLSKDTKGTPKKNKKSSSPSKMLQTSTGGSNFEDILEESDDKYHTTTTVQNLPESIDTLIKSPARRPSSAGANYNHAVQKYTINDDNLLRTQSVTDLVIHNTRSNNIFKNQPVKLSSSKVNNSSSDDVESYSDKYIIVTKNVLNYGVPNIVKQTKSVLKTASSTSPLNKKKVLFDMDAIQMKSVSASPSQSFTEKSDGNEKYELGLINLDGEEWDISSIDNDEPLKNDTRIQSVTRTSPKIAELKEKIESQLARRNEASIATLVGGVDVLAGKSNNVKASSIGGSNTSLGSSILDDSESVLMTNHKTIIKPGKIALKEDSDIDISI